MKSRRIKWAKHAEYMGKKRNAQRSLVGKHEGKKLLGSPSHRWKDNIEMILKKRDQGVNWIQLTGNRDMRWAVANRLLCLRVA
jgi:hypothetical protein